MIVRNIITSDTVSAGWLWRSTWPSIACLCDDLVWASRDQGVTWQLITSNAGFTGRAHTDADVWIDAQNHYNFILTGGKCPCCECYFVIVTRPGFIIDLSLRRYTWWWFSSLSCTWLTAYHH